MNLPQCDVLTDLSDASFDSPHGGNHRAAQVRELLETAGVRYCSLPPRADCSNFRKYLQGLAVAAQGGLSNWRRMRHHGGAAQRFRAARAKTEGLKVFVWENTHVNNHALPVLACRAGLKVFALPHNIEALVEGPGRSESCGPLLEEVQALKSADQVFCISREEQWLLSHFGLAADYLPYFPPWRLEGYFQGIRERRKKTSGERFLILGSAINPPTRQGLIELLEGLKSLRSGKDLPVDVAGFGTEALAKTVEGSGCTLHGSVSDEALGNLLVRAKAVIIHQRAAAGALTRIPEMLIAGIPVVANAIACRSAWTYPGLYCYENMPGLEQLLGSNFPTPPLPSRPREHEERFIKKVRAAVGAAGPQA